MGPSMKYERAEGEGVSKIWPIFAYDSIDRLREKRTRGREGIKMAETSAYVFSLLVLALQIDGNSCTYLATSISRRWR